MRMMVFLESDEPVQEGAAMQILRDVLEKHPEIKQAEISLRVSPHSFREEGFRGNHFYSRQIGSLGD